MSSLRQVLAEHSPVLLLDAASECIQAGLFAPPEGGAPGVRWAHSREEAGIGVFRCLESLAADPRSVRGFIFADSPGSILGIRTVAIALRVWRAAANTPVFAYNALELVAEAQVRRDLTFIADARRGSWHACRKGEAPRRAPNGELSPPLAMPIGFRHWAAPPDGTEFVPYSLEDLWPRAADAELLRPTEDPDAFLHEAPTYVTWQPQVHTAPRP